MAEKRRVQGEIVLPPGVVPSEPASVLVQVEDVSRADAPSQVVGEQRQRVPLSVGRTIHFTVEVPAEAVDDRHLYSVRVHVQVGGSEGVQKGDLISTQSYPVLTRGHGNQARVEVKRV